MGTWLVFDDENVSQIAEADIPKYFGESLAGCAYVLYYQAADIDLAALGLRTTEQTAETVLPTVPGHAADQPTPDPFLDPFPVPSSPAPPVPPGLVEEGDSSDHSDPSFPITPSLSTRQSDLAETGTFLKAPGDPGGAQPLYDSPATTPTATISPKPSKGFLDALRRSPSTKLAEGGPLADLADSSIPPLPALPPPAIPLINGKEKVEKEKEKEKEKQSSLEKDPEKEKKKSGGWFGKRKSLRISSDKRGKDDHLVAPGTAVPAVPTSPTATTSHGPPVTNGNWFKPGPPHDARKRPSDPGIGVGMSAFADLGSRPSTSSQRPLLDFSNGHTDAHATTSMSGRASLESSPSPPTTSQLDSPPAANAHAIPKTKKSLMHLTPTKSKHHAPPSSSPPTRPSTAGASSSKRSPELSTKDLPPVPPMSSERRAQAHQRKQSADVNRAEAHRLSMTAMDDSSLDTTHQPERHGISSFPNHSVANTSTSSTSGNSNLKRATRKLSITAPFLGMGKKDKKEKESRGLQTR